MQSCYNFSIHFLNLSTRIKELRLKVTKPTAIKVKFTSCFKPHAITRKPANVKRETNTQFSKGVSPLDFSGYPFIKCSHKTLN